MTVKQLRELLEAADDSAIVVFAHCDHHRLDIDQADADGRFFTLRSIGWSDDCDCEED